MLSGSVEICDVTESTESMDGENTLSSDSDDAFDITTAPYKLESPTQSLPSTLSELGKIAEQSAPIVKENTMGEEEAASAASKEEGFDLTQIKFSPSRKSTLTSIMDSYAGRERPKNEVRQQTMVILPEGKYFDITRMPFQRVSPQAIERALPQSPSLDEAAAPQASLEDNQDTKASQAIQIIAPSGQLGVIIDTSTEGGVYVSSISQTSPLLGEIFVGDVIAAVDEEEVKQAEADDVVRTLLRKSANPMRKITVLREIDDEKGYVVGTEQQLPRTDMMLSTQTLANEERYEEVEQWLLSYLPSLQEYDVANYVANLLEDGFDSMEMMEELMEDDLQFMKKAHRRALLRKLSGNLDNTNTRALPSASDPRLLAEKKVYKLNEALGEAARRGIEAKVAEAKEKRLAAAAERAEIPKKEDGVTAKEADKSTKSSSGKQQMTDEEKEAWFEEQNQLVQKRLAARLEEEKRLRDK